MIRTSAILLILLILFVKPVCAVELQDSQQLRERVQMVGGIVDTGCAMRVGNEGQTVIFQPAALHGLIRGDASFQQPLNIYLSDCGTANSGSSVRPSPALELTFEGESNGRDFSVQGAAQGIALQIKDARGKLVTPGMLLEDSSRIAGTLAFNYFLELVGTGNTLQAGNYHATIKLSIQHF